MNVRRVDVYVYFGIIAIFLVSENSTYVSGDRI